MKRNIFTISFGLLLFTLFCLSSCFETDQSNNATFGCFGTLYGSFTSGYSIISDEGILLRPTNESDTADTTKRNCWRRQWERNWTFGS